MNEEKEKKKITKRNIIVSIISIIVIIAVVALIILLNKQEPETQEEPDQDVIFDYSDSEVDMTNTENAHIEYGLKTATSEKIKEEKIYNDIRITGAEITATKNRSSFIANVKNDYDKQIEGEIIEIIFLDNNGNEFTRLETYFPDLEPNGEGQITAATEKDIANAYDYQIVRKLEN